MGYLIDTSLWIAVERGQLGAADIHAITLQEPVYVSPVNLAEIRYGIGRMKDPKQVAKATAMLRRMVRKPLLRITGETAEIFGDLAARMTRSGRGVDFRVQDLWIASQTIQRDFTLLTSNAKDFQDVPGLKFLAVPLSKWMGKPGNE